MTELTVFHSDIREILRIARQRAYTAVNFAMVEAYWLVGRRIVEEEQAGKERAGYGNKLISGLAKSLTHEFGKGINTTTLKYCRSFYLVFSASQKGHTVCDQFDDRTVPPQLSRELSWSHYRLLMRIEAPAARDYYMREAASANWSVRQLQRNINSLYYERLLSSRDKQAALQAAEAMEKVTTSDIIRDPLILEFLGLPMPPGYSEADFESAIIDNLQRFLLELGKGFSFVGRQYRVTTETKHFYIDLVFYNYLLKCFVLVDLKAGELSHQDIGQMDMYVRLFEDKIKGDDDNPTVGIILCTEKDETIVRYSVLEESRTLFASRYTTYLPSEQELRVELERERQLFLEMKQRRKKPAVTVKRGKRNG